MKFIIFAMLLAVLANVAYCESTLFRDDVEENGKLDVPSTDPTPTATSSNEDSDEDSDEDNSYYQIRIVSYAHAAPIVGYIMAYSKPENVNPTVQPPTEAPVYQPPVYKAPAPVYNPSTVLPYWLRPKA